MTGNANPPIDCGLCPRLVQLRNDTANLHPDWHNAPVSSFGPDTAELLIIGLAPGLRGANRTGRPFTGDYAGDLLYATMIKFGFATGQYLADPSDSLELKNAMITNAVRCLPPQNKPVGSEIKQCRPFLLAQIAALPALKAVLCLGRIAHDTTLSAFDLRRSSYPFSHGGSHPLPSGLQLFDSYHCSRYNTNTRRLTTDMFEAVFADISQYVKS